MSETPKRTVISRTEYNRRLAARRKKKKKQRIKMILTAITAVLIFVESIICIVLLCKNCSSDSSIVGTWFYDDNTIYRFNEDGTGCLEVGNGDYEYTYKVEGNKLSLDFEQIALHDCSYTFIVKSNTMTLVGGEGTAGGEYELRRSDASD